MDKSNNPPETMLGPASTHATGEDFIDSLGRRWIAEGKVALKTVDVAETDQERRNADYRPPPEPDPRTLSVQDLAEKLRPRRLVGDYEYRLEQPDFEVADAFIKSKTK
jgi:hypothetical protein